MVPVIARCTGLSSITNTTQLTKIKNMFIIVSEVTEGPHGRLAFMINTISSKFKIVKFWLLIDQNI